VNPAPHRRAHQSENRLQLAILVTEIERLPELTICIVPRRMGLLAQWILSLSYGKPSCVLQFVT
jgi:hypothetical protein